MEFINEVSAFFSTGNGQTVLEMTGYVIIGYIMTFW